MTRPHIIRSMVFVPAHDPEHVLRVADAGPDCICLDLEDLTPAEHKARARDVFAQIAAALHERGVVVFARTNALDGGAEEDLAAVVGPHLHCANIPKAASANDVHRFCELLAAAEARAGLEPGSVLVRPVIETAVGVHHTYEIAAASPRIAYMGGVSGGWWGDLSGDFWYEPTHTGDETFYVRSKVLAEVRAAGVPFPIGGGNIAHRDLDDVRAYITQNRDLGYNGVHCSADPAIIEVANAVFTPSRERIDGWLAVLDRLEAAEAEGLAAVVLDGTFYDLAGLPKVRANLDLARRVGVLEG